MKARYLYSELASAVQARRTNINDLATIDRGITLPRSRDLCVEWRDRWESTIESLVRDHMPSGSGFDSGTTLDMDASHAEKLVFHTSFHHMHDGGYYDGWTEHTITVTPSFQGINLRVGGRNRNNIKDYIHETFSFALGRVIEWNAERECWTVID